MLIALEIARSFWRWIRAGLPLTCPWCAERLRWRAVYCRFGSASEPRRIAWFWRFGGRRAPCPSCKHEIGQTNQAEDCPSCGTALFWGSRGLRRADLPGAVPR